MGQAQSRRASTSSQTPLNPGLSAEKVQETFYSSVNPHFADIVPDLPATVTRPAPPPRLYRVSELIDPYDLLGMAADDAVRLPLESAQSGPANLNKQLPTLVQSPSGRTLGPQEFLNHPNRPLAIRERQESIRRAVENASRNGSVESKRKGSAGAIRKCSVGTARNGSLGSIGTSLTFEQARIEEGRLAYEGKAMMKAKKGGTGQFGCLTGCFGWKG